MFKQKSVYFIGIAFLFLGLLWLHSGHMLHHSEMPSHETGHDVDLGFSLWGVIPTLLGVYLIEKHNQRLSRH